MEYEDAWLFRNSKKRPGPYNPVVVMKDGEAVPAEIYTKTNLIGPVQIPKK